MIRSLHGDLTYQIAHRLKKHVSYGDLQMFENSNTESLLLKTRVTALHGLILDLIEKVARFHRTK